MNTLIKVCWFCDCDAAATNNLFWVCGAIFKNWVYFAKEEAFLALAFFSGSVYIWIGIEISPLSSTTRFARPQQAAAQTTQTTASAANRKVPRVLRP